MDNSTDSSNGNSSSNSGGGGGNFDAVSIVALVISVIALLGSILQVLQQYYASATGYSNCDEKVMGEWHKSKRRIFRPYELRFEVQFEAPVIFVCKPDNRFGPVKNTPIYMIDGTEGSLKNTRTLLPKDDENRKRALSSKNQVHTADNERATWVTLLSELQNMERVSSDWEKRKFGEDARPPKGGGSATYEPVTPAKFSDHTLAVALQSKKRSWDTMPANVKKPYATTTMCHMVEIAAMLGIYWKEFDRSRNKYRAEGNGYVLTGDNVTDLGIMFSFQIAGKAKFEEYRIIPVDEIKELCFGYASTIFLEKEDDKRLEMQNEELSGLGKLKLSTPHEIAETLTLAGCNNNTVNYFRSDKKKVSHLFPVAFELLGMLGKTLQIPNTAFRMLPNPTCHHWDRRTFSMPKLIKAYLLCLDNEDITKQSEHTRELSRWTKSIYEELKALHNAETDFSIQLTDALHRTLDCCDAYFRGDADDEKTADNVGERVALVVREHFQVVLKMINGDQDESTANGPAAGARGSISGPAGASANNTPVSPTGGATPAGDDSLRPQSFDELNAASPEEKQAQFMEIYFCTVLPRIITHIQTLKKRNTSYKNLLAGRGHGHGHGRPHNLSVGSNYSVTPNASTSPSPVSTGFPTAPPRLEPDASAGSAASASTAVAAADGGAGLRRRGATTLQVQIQDTDGGDDRSSNGLTRSDTMVSEEQLVCNLWYTLVLRMLCWLLLHDFHKKDVQIPRSELVGSRLPVYIA